MESFMSLQFSHFFLEIIDPDCHIKQYFESTMVVPQ